MNLVLLQDGVSGSNTKNNDLENNFYLKNLNKIWEKIESLILSQNEDTLQIPHISNMIIDLSQVDVELTKAWAFLSESVKHKIKDFDVNNFVMVLMGFSKRDEANSDLWKLFENFVKNHISEFSIEDLRKIIISFLKHKEISRDFWSVLEKRICEKEILDNFTLEYFVDLQIPFAITKISDDRIWNKFEELVFRNLKTFETDKDYLMNTVYSFSRAGKGSKIFWNNFSGLIKKELNGYDIDDLGHIAVCLKSEYVEKFGLGEVLDTNFWNSFEKNVEEKLGSAKLNSLNNLLRGLGENQILNKNEKLMKKIEKRIEILIKDIPK
jgi:hypothetical protein